MCMFCLEFEMKIGKLRKNNRLQKKYVKKDQFVLYWYSPKSRNINVLRTCRTKEHFLVIEKGQKVQSQKVSSLSTLTYSKVANVTYV